MTVRQSSLLHLVAGLLLAFSVSAGDAGPVRNFGVVVEGGIYRGGQPDEAELERLKELGVRTVLKLNTHGLDEEKAACDRLGLAFIHVPSKAETIASEKSCDAVGLAFDALTNRENWPIYVHCQHGRDRTGYLIGLYRLRVERWPWKDVDQELSRYGHKWKERVAFPSITRELERSGSPCDH